MSKSPAEKYHPTSDGQCTIYRLPNLVGYHGHDLTKWRAPCFSMASRTNYAVVTEGQGQLFKIDRYTRHGEVSSPKWSFGLRTYKPVENLPGPGAYNDQSAFVKKKVVAHKFVGRPREPKCDLYPGGGYSLPSVPIKPSFRLTGKPKDRKPEDTPSPNEYGHLNYNSLKPKVPAFSFSQLPKHRTSVGPGPTSYNPTYKNYKQSPAFTFGTRHAPCKAEFIDK